MTGFRMLLVAFGAGLAVYTALVIGAHGWNFVPSYLADLSALTWPGQFDLDFTMLIALAAIWILWRNRCSWQSVVLAILLVPFVSMLRTAYLLYLSWRENGDVPRILVGDRIRSEK